MPDPNSTLTLQTVTGVLPAAEVRFALAHEHFFVDFLGPDHPDYMDVDWATVRGACVNRALELRAQGVDLVVDWTVLGVGRNALLLRDVARASGLAIVCPTGIYKALRPPAHRDLSIGALTDLFVRELTLGIEGTGIRAGFIKIATSDDAPTPAETEIHRAAARAAQETGAVIGLHAPFASAAEDVMATLSAEGFPLERLIWAHAQHSTRAAHLANAARGVIVQFDGLSGRSGSHESDQPSPQERVFDAVSALKEAGFGEQILISDDATVSVHPVERQYFGDATHVIRHARPALVVRFGERFANQLLRGNVVRAFARPSGN